MSNWPIIAATRTEVLGAGTGTGTTVSAGNPAHTKGSAVTIGTTGFPWQGFFLNAKFVPGGSGVNNRRYRLDILVNNGGSDQVIVADYFAEGNPAGLDSLFVPVAVPSGAILKARLQSDNAGSSASVMLLGFAQDFPGQRGFARVVSCTDWGSTTLPANSVTQTNQSFTAWTEIAASLPARIAMLYLHCSNMTDNSRTACDLLIEIGIGLAGNEKVIGSFFDSQGTGGFAQSSTYAIPCDIPAGKRLVFRVQCADAAAADAMGVAAMGLAA